MRCKPAVIAMHLVLAAAINSADAKTTIIHAVGIDPVALGNNHADYYENSENLLRYCRKIGLSKSGDCRVYLNLSDDYINRNDPPLLRPKSNETQGPFDSAKVLRDFGTTLKNAKPGDQIVLSLADHGIPVKGVSKSCVLSGEDRICDNDIRQILKTKRPGVKVFIIADSCFSGGFTEINNKEVCVLAASDRRLSSYKTDFWKNMNFVSGNESGLSLSQLRKMYRFGDAEGGGFASTMIRDHLCQAENSIFPKDLLEQGQPANVYFNRLSDLASTTHRLDSELINYQRLFSSPSCYRDMNPYPHQAESLLYGNIKDIVLYLQGNSNGNHLPDTQLDTIHVIEKLSKELCNPVKTSDTKLCKDLEDLQKLKPEIASWKTEPKLLSIMNQIQSLQNESYALFEKYTNPPYRYTPIAPSINEVTVIDATLGDAMEKSIKLHVQLMNAYEERIQRKPEFKAFQSLVTDIADRLCVPRTTPTALEKDVQRFVKEAMTFPDQLAATPQSYEDAKQCEDSFVMP